MSGGGLCPKSHILRAGDLLYMPRGYPHEAMSLDEMSLHLTVGIRPVTWAYILLNSIQSMFDSEPALRESLPPGFANDREAQARSEARVAELLGELVKNIAPRAVIEEARKMALLQQRPSLAGHLLDLTAEPSVQAETRVRRRSDVQWSMACEGSHIYLDFHGKRLKMPKHVEDDLRFIVEADVFNADNLPGGMDRDGKVTLVRRLLHEGFLSIASR